MELRWFTAFPPESYDCGVSLRPRPPRGEIAHGPLRLLHVLPGPLQVYPAAAPTDGWCLCSSGCSSATPSWATWCARSSCAWAWAGEGARNRRPRLSMSYVGQANAVVQEGRASLLAHVVQEGRASLLAQFREPATANDGLAGKLSPSQTTLGRSPSLTVAETPSVGNARFQPVLRATYAYRRSMTAISPSASGRRIRRCPSSTRSSQVAPSFSAPAASYQ